MKTESNETESGARYIDFTFDQRAPLMTAGRFEIRATPKTP